MMAVELFHSFNNSVKNRAYWMAAAKLRARLPDGSGCIQRAAGR